MSMRNVCRACGKEWQVNATKGTKVIIEGCPSCNHGMFKMTTKEVK